MEITATFIGHRKIEESTEINDNIENVIKELIFKHNVKTFLFGSKSKFNDLCYAETTKLKNVYPWIVRIYVRAEYLYCDEDYINYLLQFYEETYFPKQVKDSGRLSYIKRNEFMIDASDYIIFYYNDKKNSEIKSGTKNAYLYAQKKKKIIINLYQS